MLLSEAISKIQRVLGNRTDQLNSIIEELSTAQDQLERGPTFPQFLLTEDAYIRTDIDEFRIPLPDDFIAEYEEGCLWYWPDDTDTDGVCLEKYSKEYLDDLYGRVATGTPLAYARVGGYFSIFPKPDGIYEIRMKYYAKDTAISAMQQTETNKWLTYAPDTIIGKAGAVIATALRDNFALAKFTEMESEGRRVLQIKNTYDEMANSDLIMGGIAV